MVGDRADLKHFNFKLGVFTTGKAYVTVITVGRYNLASIQ